MVDDSVLCERIASLLHRPQMGVLKLNVVLWSPLHYACEKGHMSTVQLLLDSGAEIDKVGGRLM